MKISDSQRKSLEAIIERSFGLTQVDGMLETGDQESDGRAARLKNIVREYQRFLALRVLFPDRLIRPGPVADRAWRAHILDTRRYHSDCQAIFGEYLHRDPGAIDGGTSAQSAELLSSVFAPSVWGEPDPVLKSLMLEPSASLEAPSNRGDKTCA